MVEINPNKQQKLAALAERLAQAWCRNAVIANLSDDEIPATRAEAYVVQDQMASALGETLTGWKVGATSAKMRELDGHDDVIPGRIFASNTFIGTTFTLPITTFPDARVETEFAYRLVVDIPVRSQSWQVEELAPIATLHPAIEIIGNRYPKGKGVPNIGTLLTIADNGGGIGFVFGEPFSNGHDFDLQHHPIRLSIDEGAEAENFLGDMRCLPLQALADLVNHLATRNIGLRAGDFVSTGAATIPQAIRAGSHVVADFGILGRIELRFE